MKCEKCEYINGNYDIICNNCGAPLKIEDNLELQKKYNNKQRAIDIEEVEIERSKLIFDQTKKNVRIILIFFFTLLFVFFVLCIGFIYKEIRASDSLVQYNEFVEKYDFGIIYLGNDNYINETLEEYSSVYEFNYIYISTSDITTIKKHKLKDMMNISKVNSTIAILKDGQIFDYIYDISKDKMDTVNNFLQQQEMIPKQIGDPNIVLNKYNEAFNSKEPIVLYIANNKHDISIKNEKVIREFCSNYSINYTFIEGYYLTNNQKLKILEKLNYTEIHDELFVIIDEGNVKEVSESIPNTKEEYFDIISSYGIIDSNSADSLKQISFNNLKRIVDSEQKNIIVLGTSNCLYCERLKPIIGKIGIQNNLSIYYLNIKDNELSSVETYLTSINYKEGKISMPLVIIVENGQLLDYIIGLSDKSLYEDKFTELGIMR